MWSLESELKSLVGAESLEEALRAMGLLGRGPSTFEVHTDERGWRRLGAETFGFEFSLDRVGEKPVHLLLKACTAYSPGSSIDEILDRWIRRRRTLETAGASCPRLYVYGKGLLLEEWIPMALEDALVAKDAWRELLGPLRRLVGVVAGCGFRPIALLSNLRSRGTDAVVVDFGEDLGEPGEGSGDPEAVLGLVKRELGRINSAEAQLISQGLSGGWSQ